MSRTFVNDDSHPLPAEVAHSYDVQGLSTKQDIDYSPLNRIYGEDGVFSNLVDLSKWDQALYPAAKPGQPATSIVSDNMLATIFKSGQLNDGTATGYGFGWFVNQDGTFMDHSGEWAGYRTYIRRYPQSRLTIVVLSNFKCFDAATVGDRIATIYGGPRRGT
jgi:CubicO group peptidase (beta-lactamase class C family)